MEADSLNLIAILAKRRRLIYGLTIAAVLISAFICLFVIKPKYQASVTLLVQPKRSDNYIRYEDVITTERLVSTYSQVIKSRRTAGDVIKRLNLDISETDLLKKVTAANLRDSLVTMISVADTDPERALKIAGAFASSFVTNLPDLMYIENVTVLDDAVLDNKGKPVSPKVWFFVGVSFFLGLTAGTGAAALLEVLVKVVDTEEIAEEIGRCPVLAWIPKHNYTGWKPVLRPDGTWLRREIPALDRPDSHVAESFRILRTGLNQFIAVHGIKSLLVTSPMPLEGKTSVCANLAVSLAQEGRKILLMDCDLRRPSVHQVFSVPGNAGVSDLMTGVSGSQVAGNLITTTEQDNLYIMPAGPILGNPAELLASGLLKEILAAFRDFFYLILIDSPPVLPVTDTQIISGLCDAVLLVARAGTTPRHALARTRIILDRAGAHVAGAALNAKVTREGYGYGYYRS